MNRSSSGWCRRLLAAPRRLVQVARAAWVAFGLAVGLLLAVEAAYRAQAAVRGAVARWRAPAGPANAVADEAWYRRLMDETAATRYAWRPFVYYRRLPFHGRLLNVDRLGRRVTIQAIAPGPARRQVFLFGGSPMWGTGLRDSMTIPSRLAREIAAGGERDVAVLNFGEAGYVFTQDLMELLLQLRDGARPALVIFYGGYNEIQAAMENGEAGGTKAEAEAARDFGLVRSLFTWRTDPATEARVATRLAGILAHRLQFVQRFLPRTRPTAAPSDDAVAAAVAQDYLRTVDIVEALADAYRFTALYAWMPVLDSAKTHRSALESALYRDERRSPSMSRFLDLRGTVLARVKPAMLAAAPGRFADLSTLFAADTEAVFLDDQAHTTEAGSEAVAAALATHVQPLLARAAGPRGGGGRVKGP